MLRTLKRWVQSTIGVSSKEANAFIILLPTLFILISSQPVYRWFKYSDNAVSIKESFLLDSIVAQKKQENAEPIKDSVVLHAFDPNTASVDELVSLGIAKSIAHRIEQYRLKGGQFRVKSDLAKIYGLEGKLYQVLVNYIELPDEIVKTGQPNTQSDVALNVEYDLNLADTADLKSVNGIGPVLAERIVKYRNSLGGFTSVNQLNEVFGLDTLVIKEMRKFFVSPDFRPGSLNINQATEEVLDKHPYITLKQARAILTYRLQHGKFSSLDDLRKVKLLDDRMINRIQPYLSFD